MQQYLPFTVLKLLYRSLYVLEDMRLVATVLTVYGIETSIMEAYCFLPEVATVLTVYGIETLCS